jgi:hypothetical protein
VEYINHKISELNQREFACASDHQIATWFKLLIYCVSQENGGRITACSDFDPRTWQSLCRVDGRKIKNPSPLWSWDNDDLIIWNYPTDKENEVQSNRHAARIGGQAKTQAKRLTAAANGAKGGRPRNPSETQAEPKHNPSGTQAQPKHNPSENPTERNVIGKECNVIGKEAPLPPQGEASEPAPLSQTPIETHDPHPLQREIDRTLPSHLDTPSFRQLWAEWIDYRTTLNHDRPLPSQTWDAHLRTLANLTPADAAKALENAINLTLRSPALPFAKKTADFAPAEPTLDPNRPYHPTGGYEDCTSYLPPTPSPAATGSQPTP